MNELKPIIYGVSDFVAVFNQTLDYAYPSVQVIGELANFRISRGAWVYFDLKDEDSTVRCFGNVYQLPGPLENGMIIKVSATPRLHERYGFNLNIKTIQPSGEGSIKKASNLLESKLAQEGLFAPARKRFIVYPPQIIGLVTSGESAACGDFIKVLGERWGGIDIILSDVQVQGEPAAGQIVAAIEKFNQLAWPPEVLVVIRGGGSGEDLQAFNVEQVVRAVAASRIPTLVAIGHERDISLAELAADVRASTPSNAAEILVPDRRQEIARIREAESRMSALIKHRLADAGQQLNQTHANLRVAFNILLARVNDRLDGRIKLLVALSPQAVMERGYAIIRSRERIIKTAAGLHSGTIINIDMLGGSARASIQTVLLINQKDR